MKFYDLDDVFTFGKYEGQTIAEVFEKDPKYIKYCEENIDEFYVSSALKRDLKSLGRAASDSALLGMDFDKMTDDEIAAFMSNMDDDNEFSSDRLEKDFDWENADIADDAPYDGLESDIDDEIMDEFNEFSDYDDGFGDSFRDDRFDDPF